MIYFSDEIAIHNYNQFIITQLSPVIRHGIRHSVTFPS